MKNDCIRTYVIKYQLGSRGIIAGRLLIKAKSQAEALKIVNKRLRKQTFRVTSIVEKE